MNTHDKIVKCRSCGYIGPCDPTCCERPDYDGATAEEAWEAAIEAHHKRRGEPVAWTTPDGREPISSAVKESRLDLHGKNYTVPLYAAPQPAEPVKHPSYDTDCCQGHEPESTCKCAAHDAAELVKVPSDTAILEVWQSYRDFPVDWICQFARTILARYGQITEPVKIDVDALAQEIRRVNGNNDLGAGALAEALMPFLESALQSQDMKPVIDALEAAQNNACGPVRPFGSSDPNSDDYDQDAFMWDYYQRAIDHARRVDGGGK